MGPDLATRGEGNELKDVFAKLQKKTAAEEVQMHLAQMVGESADLDLAETMSEASTKGMEKHRVSITISDGEVVFCYATDTNIRLLLSYDIIQIALNQPCDMTYALCLCLNLDHAYKSIRLLPHFYFRLQNTGSCVDERGAVVSTHYT